MAKNESERNAVATAPARDEMRRRARLLVPAIRARAPEAEALRQLPDATIRDLHETGLWRINQPARVGGPQLDYQLLVETSSEFARACGSTGWVFMNLGVHHWMLGLRSSRGGSSVDRAHPTTPSPSATPLLPREEGKHLRPSPCSGGGNQGSRSPAAKSSRRSTSVKLLAMPRLIRTAPELLPSMHRRKSSSVSRLSWPG